MRGKGGRKTSVSVMKNTPIFKSSRRGDFAREGFPMEMERTSVLLTILFEKGEVVLILGLLRRNGAILWQRGGELRILKKERVS